TAAFVGHLLLGRRGEQGVRSKEQGARSKEVATTSVGAGLVPARPRRPPPHRRRLPSRALLVGAGLVPARPRNLPPLHRNERPPRTAPQASGPCARPQAEAAASALRPYGPHREW